MTTNIKLLTDINYTQRVIKHVLGVSQNERVMVKTSYNRAWVGLGSTKKQ